MYILVHSCYWEIKKMFDTKREVLEYANTFYHETFKDTPNYNKKLEIKTIKQVKELFEKQLYILFKKM